jgi:hypothetical protein
MACDVFLCFWVVVLFGGKKWWDQKWRRMQEVLARGFGI